MIQSSVLPFKLKRTQEEITPRSGLAVFAEFMKALGVEGWINLYLPGPGSGRGYQPLDYVKGLSIMLYGGGSAVEDLREIRQDHALRRLVGLTTVPSSSAVGDWLRRMGERGGLKGMQRVNTAIVQEVIRRDSREGYTLIVDPFIVKAEKYQAHMTYTGVKGYRPVVATLRELGVVVAHRFKEGNDNSGRVELLQEGFKHIPSGKKIELVLLDAEYYSQEVMEYLEGQGVSWAIGADKDHAVREEIEAIPEGQWEVLKGREGISTDREVASTVHTTNKGKGSFRLVVIRWREPQLELFRNGYNYHVIATNLPWPEQEVVWEYNSRANIENHIKEMVWGFGLADMPSGDFSANAMYFSIGVMTYNVWIAQKQLLLPQTWWNKTIGTMRWAVIGTAGRVIRHGRQVILSLASTIEKYKLYLLMRRRCVELSTG